MEATVVSVGKSVLDGALSYAKSAVAEEVALQLGVQRDQTFIREELEMMRSFLMAAHEERDENKVLKTWVKQVQDVAYDVEYCLQEFAVHLEKPSRWRIPRTLRERRRIAKQMKELRARVEDVSKRNRRYQLNKDPTSKPATAAAQSISRASATMFGINEARRFAKQDKPKVDLVQLINKEDKDLRVIAVWGTGGDVGLTSIIREAYENPNIKGKFPCRAWVRVMHPFNRKIFVQSLVKQFNAPVGVDVMLETEKTERDLAQELNRYVNEESFLVVLNDLSTIEEWDQIKACFVSNKKGSRIIVSTAQVEVASLCPGQESIVSELKMLSADQTLYVFYKVSHDGTDSAKPGSGSGAAVTSTKTSTVSKSADGGSTALAESQLIGRKKEKDYIKGLISKKASQHFEVISVWRMGGLGKTALVKDIYQELKFEKRACVTVIRPFNREELLRSLVQQLDAEPSEKKGMVGLLGSKKKEELALMGHKELTEKLAKFLDGHSCLIVLDDVSSTAEWDQLISRSSHENTKNTSRIIVTTREEKIAKHCSDQKQDNIYKLQVLEDKDAQDLFTKKVFKEIVDLDKQYPELAQEAKPILKKCNGLPLAIVTIGDFLAKQPKSVVEWRKLNEHISAELDMNPVLGTIKTVLEESYNSLPYHLKSCFLYLPIFPKDQEVSRRRLVRRWTAEGYSREVLDKSAEEVADSYFLELIDKSMILPAQISIHSRKGIDSCRVHDLMRDIGISKSKEEDLVFRLEEGCNLNTQGRMRHLAITSSSWEGDKSEFESKVDMSRIRSLTVFGKWRPFFISDKMRLLRVIDLEDTEDLVNHHLEHIGKLLHLRYLSLRGCIRIYHLPDSLGKLRQLETLDIRDTLIIKLPKSIIKLRKLNYLRAGIIREDEYVWYEEIAEVAPKLMTNRLCLLTLWLVILCVICSVSSVMDDDLSRSDICTIGCCLVLPAIAMRLDINGVAVPRGMRKLKALHTLGVVNVARGKAVLHEIKSLTRLRKLGVTGINKKNGQKFCIALATLSCLESLSVRSEGEPDLFECLDEVSSPPKNLQSLKLYGNLVKLPEWIQDLKNLVKLKLRSTRLSEHNVAMRVLGNLPSLANLCLWNKSFQGKELCFIFSPETFRSLVMLQLDGVDELELVVFGEGATPKLQSLEVDHCRYGIFGLSSLESLKEVKLKGSSSRHVLVEEDVQEGWVLLHGGWVEDVQAQLSRNRNQPVLKMD